MNFKKSKIKKYDSDQEYIFIPANSIELNKKNIDSIVSVCNEEKIYNQLFKGMCSERPYNSDHARGFLNWAKEGFENKSHFVFFILDQDKLPIGAIDIKSSNKPNGEIGYWLSSHHSGLMTNAVKELCTQAKEAGYTALYGLCELGNEKSQNVLKRARFRFSEEVQLNNKHYQKFQIEL